MAATFQLMPRLQEVGTTLHPTNADETRARLAGNDLFAADDSGRQKAATAATTVVESQQQFWSSNDGREQSPLRSPSPEYVDAVQEPQYELQDDGATMGETVTRGDTNEASSGQKVLGGLTPSTRSVCGCKNS